MEESEILTLRAKAAGELFERLTEQLMNVRRKIFAIEPIPSLDRILPEVWERITRMTAEMDGRIIDS